jgi:hypothetical protein
MGSTSSQGWYLLLFLLGFTLGPAGLYALGWPTAVVGFALLVISFAGFRSIKEPAAPGRAAPRRTPAPAATLEARSANGF